MRFPWAIQEKIYITWRPHRQPLHGPFHRHHRLRPQPQIHEERLAAVPVIHYLIARSRIFHTQFARHSKNLATGTKCVNSKKPSPF